MGGKPEKFTASLACEVESGQAPGGSEGNFKPDPKGGSVSVAREGEPTKSGCLNFDPSGISTIRSRKLDRESESNNASRG